MMKVGEERQGSKRRGPGIGNSKTMRMGMKLKET